MFYQNILIFVLVFIIWLCVLRWQRRKKIQSCNQFKNGIWKAPLIGHAYMMLGNAETKMKAFQEFGREALKNGGVTSTYFWFFGMFYFVIADPVVAELVLKNCLEKDDSMKLFKNVLGDGILVAPVPVWRPRRKVLNPTFNLKNLNHFVEIFRKNSKVMVEKLENEVDMGPFSIYEYASGYSLDSVCVKQESRRVHLRPETMLGTELGSQKTQRNPVMEAVNTCCCLVSHRMCLPWLYNQTIYELTPQWTLMKENAGILFDFIGAFISAKLQQYKDKAKTKEINNCDDSQNQGLKTLLQLMIENSNNETLPTEEFLKEEILVVTFAGTDTTSVGFSFIMLMLAAHPEVQEKVYNEISEVLGDMTRPIEAEDLPRLKYMEAVIKETLRLYPPAPLILRKIEKDLVLPNGKTLVAGTGALVNIWATHRNTEYWGPDAEDFRPERFLAPLPHPAAFLAFSFGVRNCIGYQYAIMSLKTSITSILRQFRVTSANKQTNSQEPLRVQFDIMMRDVNNFKIQLKSR